MSKTKKSRMIAKPVKQTVQPKPISISTWIKIFAIIRLIATALIKTKLWEKLGISKYWKDAGMLIALVGSVWANISNYQEQPEIMNQVQILYNQIDSTYSAENAALSDSIKVLNGEVKELKAAKNAFVVVPPSK